MRGPFGAVRHREEDKGGSALPVVLVIDKHRSMWRTINTGEAGEPASRRVSFRAWTRSGTTSRRRGARRWLRDLRRWWGTARACWCWAPCRAWRRCGRRFQRLPGPLSLDRAHLFQRREGRGDVPAACVAESAFSRLDTVFRTAFDQSGACFGQLRAKAGGMGTGAEASNALMGRAGQTPAATLTPSPD